MQVVKQNLGLFGRIGKGLGQGLSEQLPKEIERGRLSAGLKKLEQEKDLDPFQFFTKAASLPGMNPQLLDSLAKLSKQRMQGKSLGSTGAGDAKGRSEAFFGAEGGKETPRGSETASITTKEPIQETLKPYIPMSPQQIDAVAKDLFDKNPARFNGDPAEAIAYAQQIDNQNLTRNQALQGQRKNENEVQANVRQTLKAQNDLLGNKIPSNVYSKIEDQAIEDVKNGRKTEHQAAKDYGKELEKISREYNALAGVGKVAFAVRDKGEIKRELRSIRNNFKERDDLENLADKYISENHLSPSKAHYLAYPVSDIKGLNNALVQLPKLESKPEAFGRTNKQGELVTPEYLAKKTLAIAPKIAELAFNGNDASPLAISEELKAKGYDADTWMDYVDKNRDKLRLNERQARELSKVRNPIPTLNDIFLFYNSGLDALMEND